MGKKIKVLLIFVGIIFVVAFMGCSKDTESKNQSEIVKEENSILKEPPEISITIHGQEVFYVVGKEVWDGVVYDTLDNFEAILKVKSLDEIQSFKKGSKVEIDFGQNDPTEVELYDVFLKEDGRKLYKDLEDDKVNLQLVDGKVTFEVEPHKNSYLSSDSEIENKTLRGYRVFATLGNNRCEYTFIIKNTENKETSSVKNGKDFRKSANRKINLEELFGLDKNKVGQIWYYYGPIETGLAHKLNKVVQKNNEVSELQFYQFDASGAGALGEGRPAQIHVPDVVYSLKEGCLYKKIDDLETIELKEPLEINNTWETKVNVRGVVYDAIATITDIVEEKEENHGEQYVVEVVAQNVPNYKNGKYISTNIYEIGKGIYKQDFEIAYSEGQYSMHYTLFRITEDQDLFYDAVVFLRDKAATVLEDSYGHKYILATDMWLDENGDMIGDDSSRYIVIDYGKEELKVVFDDIVQLSNIDIKVINENEIFIIREGHVSYFVSKYSYDVDEGKYRISEEYVNKDNDWNIPQYNITNKNSIEVLEIDENRRERMAKIFGTEKIQLVSQVQTENDIVNREIDLYAEGELFNDKCLYIKKNQRWILVSTDESGNEVVLFDEKLKEYGNVQCFVYEDNKETGSNYNIYLKVDQINSIKIFEFMYDREKGEYIKKTIVDEVVGLV